MARFLLVVSVVSAASAGLFLSSPRPAAQVAPGTVAAPQEIPAPRELKPAPPGFLSRVGVARTNDPPEFAPSLAGYPLAAVRRVAFSPDGRRMLTCGSSPGSSRVWADLAGPPVAGLDHEETHPTRAPAFSPDGRHLVGVSGNRLAVWDADTGVLVHWAPDPAEVASTDRALGFDPDGRAWAIDTASGTLSRQRVPAGDVLRTMMGYPQTEYALVSANGARLAVGGAAFAVRSTHPDAAWQLISALPVRRKVAMRGGRTVTVPLAFSPTGRLLVAGSARGTYLLGQFAVWDVTDRPVAVVEYGPADSEWLIDVSFSANGHWIAFQVERPGSVMEVRVWEAATLAEAWRFAPADGTAFAFHPDARRVVVGHADSTLTVWDRATLEATAAARPGRGELAAALADANPKAGVAAIHALTADPVAGVAFLREQFKPIDPAKAAALIGDLDDDDFGTREEASKELAALGERAEGVLRKAATESTSPEVRTRADKLVGAFVPVNGRLSAAHVKAGRAAEALERIGTSEAQALLARWAAENDGTHLGAEAKAALGRLK